MTEATAKATPAYRWQALLATWRTDISDRSSLFTLLWVVCILAHFDEMRNVARMDVPLGLACFVGLGLLFSRCAPLVGGIAAIQIAEWWHVMPESSNHWLAMAFGSTAILLQICITQWRKPGTWLVLDADWLESALPFLRLLAVLIYSFAAFHKLNWDFLNPATSCGGFAYAASRGISVLRLLPDWPLLAYLPVYGCLATEIVTPILLSLRRTWFLGIITGGALHLATATFMRTFPTLMFALYILFIPKPVLDVVIERISRLIGRISFGKLGLRGALQVQAVLFYAWTTYVCAKGETFYAPVKTAYYQMHFFWLVLLVALLAFVGILMLRRKSFLLAEGRSPLRAIPLYGVILGALFACNGFAPQLGLKDEVSMTMWSNLRCSGGTSNHLFWPSKLLRPFSYMDDVVELRETNSAAIRQHFAYGHYALAHTMFLRILQQEADAGTPFWVSYSRNGASLKRLEQRDFVDDALREPWWSAKIIGIRPIPRRDLGVCDW